MTNSTTFDAITPAPQTPARLYRSRTDKRLFGVCGGIAQHFDVDPNLVRLAVAALALFGGTSIPLYILAAVILPEQSAASEPPSVGAPLSAIA